jgi:hypothetical protein
MLCLRRGFRYRLSRSKGDHSHLYRQLGLLRSAIAGDYQWLIAMENRGVYVR